MKTTREESGQKQRDILGNVQEQIFLRNRTFMDIMRGPNPLTPEEIRKLIEKRPALWGAYAGFAEKKG